MTEKPRIRYDYRRHFWRWSSGHPVRVCVICGGPHIRQGICHKCQDARRAEISRGKVIWLRESGRPRAYPALNSGEVHCVDCIMRNITHPKAGKIQAATEWDHRDWREPLKVEPVCRNHNAQRGRAMTAFEASFLDIRSPRPYHPDSSLYRLSLPHLSRNTARSCGSFLT